MINLIVGKKGSGKTKSLIEQVNRRAEESPGHVVCIEKGLKLTYDIKHSVKLIDILDYKVLDFTSLYGFLMGLFASNYDTTDIFVDNVLSFCGRDLQALGYMLDKISTIDAFKDVNLTLTVSADLEEFPDNLKTFVAQA